MSEPPASAPTKASQLHPSFGRSWSAVWLFTWKSQLTWRRLRTMSIMLLILPFLLWKTTTSPSAWAQRDRSFQALANSVVDSARAVRRITSPRVSTKPDTNQIEQVRLIFSSEYNRAQIAFRNIQSPETSMDQQREIVQTCYQHILDRVRSVLDTRQFDELSRLNKELESNAEDQIGAVSWNRTAPFYHWVIDFYFFIILPFSCVWACGGLIRDELQNDTLGFLTTRPVKRANLVLLKYLAQVSWLEMVVLVEGLLLFGAGALRQIPELGSLFPLFLGVQFLAVPAWSALGLCLGQLSKRYLPLSLVYGLIVELGIGDIPTNINTLSLMRHLKALLSNNHDLQGLYEWSGTGVFLPIGALILACGLFVGLSAFLFTFREYHANTEMQK